jgi:hypothetical protein
MQRFLIAASVLLLATVATAQQVKFPSTFGGSIAVSKGHSYGIVTTDVWNLARGPKWSIDLQGFVGSETATPSPVTGSDLAFGWNVAPNANLFAGPGVLVPVDQLSFKSLSTAKWVLVLGGQLRFSTVSGSGASASERRVISG